MSSLKETKVNAERKQKTAMELRIVANKTTPYLSAVESSFN